VLGVYARVGPLFVAGEGSELIAEDGTRYLDSSPGSLSTPRHTTRVFRDAVLRAPRVGLVARLRTLYRTERASGWRGADESRIPLGGQAFFCNSGAEANEGASSSRAKWSQKTESRVQRIVPGRLFASLAATIV